MIIITVFDKTKLQEMVNNFYNVTGTILAFYDEQNNYICGSANSMSRFCSEIRKSYTLSEKCHICDKIALKKCAEKRKPYIYHCHMGLLEIAVPIIHNNQIIGYLLFGQICDNKDKTKIKDILSQTKEINNLNKEKLFAELNKIKYRSEEYIKSISKIVEMAISYIWLSNIINVRDDSLAYSIEKYIDDNISQVITIKKLCKEFNISNTALYNLSIEKFKCSISRFIKNKRIEEAKRLLLKSNLSTIQIAENVGISDTNYFIRWFKKNTGETPHQYKIKNKTDSLPLNSSIDNTVESLALG